jgi:integrase
VAAAYEVSPELGLFSEVGATTAARPSQLARLTCADAQPDRVMMPSSKKGRGRRMVKRKPVPIPPRLAGRLLALAKDRPREAPLLTMPSGGPWLPGGYYRPFGVAVKAAGLDPDKVTFYAFRHTYITNALLRGTPVRLVADAVDPSVVMIERTYSAYISHHGDALLRAGMLDLSIEPATAANVVNMKRPKATA